jgi:Ca-activated chloride channel family protein
MIAGAMRRLALALTLLAAPAAAQDSVLVLDASNSMWGRVDARPKIAIARDAVAALARSLPPGTRMGLTAYGHRRAGDCADIEALIPVGPVDAGAFARAAASLTPRGRTPIADSIAAAARAAPRVILVSDGIETCVPDACAAVRALKAQNPALTVHVIGFDVAEARDQAQLRCIADATGGRFVPAASAADLAAALAAVTETRPPPAPPAPPPAPAAQEVNLTLEAVEVEGGPTVPIGAWNLFALSDPPRQVLNNNGAARPSLRVPAGRYEVRVRAGTATLAERFDASGAQQVHRVVLNLGTLRPVAALAPGAPPLGGNWTILADEAPGARAGETVTTNGAAEPAIRLVQGSYRVRFQAGEARGEADVFVEAGRVVPLRLDLMAAELRLLATRGGAPVEGGLLWEMRRAAEPRAAATSGAQRARFVLPAGEWVVRLRSGGQWIEAPLSLRAGESREVAVPLP